jgi:hypothetical protein
MAVSQAQIVDLLYKEAFGVTKTDTATNKSPSNESIPSPLLIRGDTQWTQSDQIPDIAAAVTDLVQAYTGANAVQCVADNTTVPIGGIYPTWKTNLTYWIPAEFGATYSVKVWVDNPGVANPTSTGTQIFADGSGGNGQFYYNYQSGVLNFIGETIPAALTSGKVLYVVGYRYIGLVGVTNLPSNTNIGNLNVTGSTIISTNSDGNIILTPDGNGIVQISSALTSNANITASFYIGNGSQLSGVAASNAVSAGTVTDSAQPNITSVGTLVSLDVAGNLSAGNANLGNLTISNFFSGNGNLLSNITGANVVGNVTSAITANFANYAGNVTVAAQPNITSVGTLTSLEVTGNGTFGNISTTGSGGNITGANYVIANFFSGDGGYLTNVAAGNSNTAVTSGTVTASSQPNITSVGTLVSLDITGNLTAGNANLGNLTISNFFSGSGNLLSNIQGSNVTGNVTSAVTANFANFAGNITVASQPNITSVGNLTSLVVAGNLSADNANLGNLVTANFITGTLTTNAQPNITSVGNLTSLDVTGNLSANNANLGNLVTANFITGTLTTNAQPNITSVGNLTSLEVTGNATVGGILTDNYYYSNGDPVDFQQTGGVNTSIQFNNDGNFGGNANFTFDSVTGNILIPGNLSWVDGGGIWNYAPGEVTISANVANDATSINLQDGEGAYLYGVTEVVISANTSGTVYDWTFSQDGNLTAPSIGTIDAGNLVTANYVTGTLTTNAQPNITSVGNLTSLVVTGNLSAGNANLGNLVTANYVTGTLTTNAQPNITSVGNLISLDVTGNGTFGNISTTGSGGNITGANYVIANFFSGSGNNLSNIQGSNVVGNVTSAVTANFANYAGNVTASSQPNITSVGNLTSLTVLGNANTGNLDTTNLIATGTGSFGANVNMNTYWINNVGYPNLTTDVATKAYVDTMVSTGIAYHQPVLAATTTTLSIETSGTTTYVEPNGAGNGVGAYISTTGTYLTIDGANVQTVGTRILVKNESNAAWNGVYTYANTTAIIRATDADEYGPDSTTQLSVNDFFFTTGGYVNEGVGFIVSGPSGEITFGTSNITFAVFTTAQVYDAGTGLTLVNTTFNIADTTVTAGSYGDGDNVASFTVNEQGQLTAASNTVITANAANLSGTVLASNIVTSSLTTVGTLTGLDVDGNLTAINITANTGVFTGNGSGLISLTGGNVTGEVAYANVANNVAGGNVSGQVANALVAGTVYTADQSAITKVGTLTELNVAGLSNLGPVSNVTITGGSNNYFLKTDGSGNLNWASVPTGTGISNGNSNVEIYTTDGNINMSVNGNANIVTISDIGANINGVLNVTGNITAGNANLGNAVHASYFIGSAANLIDIPAGNINGQVANANIASTVYTANQPNITSVGNLTSLTVLGNVTGGNADLGNAVTANYFLGNGSLLTGIATATTAAAVANGTSNVNIPFINGNINLSASGNANVLVVSGTGVSVNGDGNVNGNLTTNNIVTGNGLGGSITGANLMSANYFTGTITTNAQPNITSLGTLTSLEVSGTSNLGPVGNVTITGGSSGYVLSTNGSGGLSWIGISSSGISNGNSNVSIPTSNGNVNISAVGNANVLVITGTGANINGTLDITGNLSTGNINAGSGSGGSLTGANLVSANYISGTLTTAAQPNITSVGTLTSLEITGNLSAANANLGNAVTANYFIGSGANLTNIPAGNISGQVANALVAGTVYTAAQGNITSVGTLTSLDVSGHLIANTFQMGYGVYAFYSTSVYFATTASTSNNQVLWSYPAADLSAIDFTIIATDSVGATRQSCKISAAILGTSVAYTEYGGLFINGGVGSFGVVYNGSGPTPTLDLVVTPDSSNLTEYNMLISKYLV